MYGVIHRRRGQIVSEEMIEGSSTFTVTAHIPVIESLNLANELRYVFIEVVLFIQGVLI